MIKKSMKDLEEDLQRLHLLIKKWNDGLFGDRYLVFVWTDMSTVVEIRNTLKDHHEHNIRRNVDLLKMHLDNVRYKKDKEAAKKAELAKIEENKKQRADLIRDRLTRDKQHADLQKLLEALLRQSSGKLMLNAAASSDPQQWAAIENSYMTMKQDTSRIEAQRVLNPIKDELRRLSACASPKKIPILETKTSIQGQMEQADSLHLSKGDDKATKADLSKTGRDDGKKGDETAHDHAKKKKKKKDVLKQHAMENTSDSNSPKPVDASSSKNGPGNCTLGNVDSGTSCADSAGDLQIGAATSDQKAFKSKSRMLKTGKRTICVDASHGMQSILTQTYLEMIRAWTANASGDWLANRIQSAGYQVDTPFARLALAAGHLSGDLVKTDTTWRSALINAVNAVGSRKWPLTPDWPDEKAEILARMKERGRNGMKEDYFEDFDFILCFDIQAYATLRSLRAFAPEQRSASKVPLKGWIVRLDVPVSSTTTIPSLELLRALEGAVSGFLTKNLDWTAPKKGLQVGCIERDSSPSRTTKKT